MAGRSDTGYCLSSQRYKNREIAVDLPRPRGRTAPEFQKMKEEVTLALDIS